jgi:hypothetical protein
MPTLRSATLSPAPAATPSPTAATTPRSAKRRLTPRRAADSADSAQFTAPHTSPLAAAGPVSSPALHPTRICVTAAQLPTASHPNAHQLLDHRRWAPRRCSRRRPNPPGSVSTATSSRRRSPGGTHEASL